MKTIALCECSLMSTDIRNQALLMQVRTTLYSMGTSLVSKRVVYVDRYMQRKGVTYFRILCVSKNMDCLEYYSYCPVHKEQK